MISLMYENQSLTWAMCGTGVMKMLQVIVAWTPSDGELEDGETPGEIQVSPWPDVTRWADRVAFTDGACETHWHEVEQSELSLKSLSCSTPSWFAMGLNIKNGLRLILRDGGLFSSNSAGYRLFAHK